MENRKRYEIGKKPGLVLGVHYCAKCGGELTSRGYEDGVGVSFETGECFSCGLMWQIAQFSSGEVRIAEISPDEESPEGMVALE